MATIDFLQNFDLDQRESAVYVKILSIWNKRGDIAGEPTTIILCDEKGTKVDAIVPARNYKNNFKLGLTEGSWYYMANFHVERSDGPIKYAECSFQIEFIWPTKIWHVSPRSSYSFCDILYPDELEYSGEHDRQFTTDAMGVISSVSKIKRFPNVCREGESDYHVRYVTFNIVDNQDKLITCVAVGRMCEVFTSEFYRRTSAPAYNYEPLVVLIRFWRITEYEGRNTLFGEDGPSRIHFDPTFPVYNCHKFIKGFREDYEGKEPLKMVVVMED